MRKEHLLKIWHWVLIKEGPKEFEKHLMTSCLFVGGSLQRAELQDDCHGQLY